VEGEVLVLYLTASEHAVSAVLVVERAKKQILVYNISHTLAGAEVNYPLIEKFVYALVMASRTILQGSQNLSLNGPTLEERPPKVRCLRAALEVSHRTLPL